MVMDARGSYLSFLHQGLSTILSPLQYLVDAPTRIVSSAQTHIRQQQSLLDENLLVKIHLR